MQETARRPRPCQGPGLRRLAVAVLVASGPLPVAALDENDLVPDLEAINASPVTLAPRNALESLQTRDGRVRYSTGFMGRKVCITTRPPDGRQPFDAGSSFFSICD